MSVSVYSAFVPIVPYLPPDRIVVGEALAAFCMVNKPVTISLLFNLPSAFIGYALVAASSLSAGSLTYVRSFNAVMLMRLMVYVVIPPLLLTKLVSIRYGNVSFFIVPPLFDTLRRLFFFQITT